MKRIIFFILLFLSTACFAVAQNSDIVQQYIEKYKALAINEEKRTGVPAAITLAQGIYESGAGQSDLALASNNHFGIKCKENWTGAKVYHDDDAKNECFRSYPTVEDSYRDHSDFLRNRPNYAFLFSIDPTDYEAWAKGLKKAGYATSNVYAANIIRLIKENNLEQYTLIALGRLPDNDQTMVAANNVSNNTPVVNTAVANPSLNSDNAAVENNEPVEPKLTEYKEGSFPSGIFTINKTKVIFAKAGTSLFALASNNNISFSKLLEFNELNNVDILPADQLIYLERKPKRSDKDFHVVSPNETIEEIAQVEGVQLESLFEYNKMQKGLEPAAGEKIYLKPGKPSYFPKLLARSGK